MFEEDENIFKRNLCDKFMYFLAKNKNMFVGEYLSKFYVKYFDDTKGNLTFLRNLSS
jgi:hypothetical protein